MTLKDRPVLKGKIVIIPDLDGMVDQVIRMRPETRVQIGDELISRVKGVFEVLSDEEKE